MRPVDPFPLDASGAGPLSHDDVIAALRGADTVVPALSGPPPATVVAAGRRRQRRRTAALFGGCAAASVLVGGVGVAVTRPEANTGLPAGAPTSASGAPAPARSSFPYAPGSPNTSTTWVTYTPGAACTNDTIEIHLADADLTGAIDAAGAVTLRAGGVPLPVLRDPGPGLRIFGYGGGALVLGVAPQGSDRVEIVAPAVGKEIGGGGGATGSQRCAFRALVTAETLAENGETSATGASPGWDVVWTDHAGQPHSLAGDPLDTVVLGRPGRAVRVTVSAAKRRYWVCQVATGGCRLAAGGVLDGRPRTLEIRGGWSGDGDQRSDLGWAFVVPGKPVNPRFVPDLSSAVDDPLAMTYLPRADVTVLTWHGHVTDPTAAPPVRNSPPAGSLTWTDASGAKTLRTQSQLYG